MGEVAMKVWIRADAGAGEGLAGGVDIAIHGAGQATDGAVLDDRGDRLDGLEVARTGDGEPRLDDIDPELFQGLGNAHLFLLGHGGAWTLLAIPEGGIENDEMFFAHGALPPRLDPLGRRYR
jgi:hypothetical protein